MAKLLLVLIVGILACIVFAGAQDQYRPEQSLIDDSTMATASTGLALNDDLSQRHVKRCIHYLNCSVLEILAGRCSHSHSRRHQSRHGDGDEDEEWWNRAIVDEQSRSWNKLVNKWSFWLCCIVGLIHTYFVPHFRLDGRDWYETDVMISIAVLAAAMKSQFAVISITIIMYLE